MLLKVVGERKRVWERKHIIKQKDRVVNIYKDCKGSNLHLAGVHSGDSKSVSTDELYSQLSPCSTFILEQSWNVKFKILNLTIYINPSPLVTLRFNTVKV